MWRGERHNRKSIDECASADFFRYLVLIELGGGAHAEA